ncbi:RNA-directed DNA polymerase [Phytophthora megakarya]|uniref:RNA-directed DNA polymerase n=1 Tax=Phytophthora megakarya TaxID=4795 RepID=A0A225V258_9STRA|nr:RNA-directed DNA polymerase [Phytophthora megakarya]
MNAVLRGLTWQTCLVYLDDVIIFTKGDVAQHVVELATVLERLSQAGLSLKAKKCTFAATKPQYLGHELDAEGMESLVRSVVEFPEPTDSAEVKRFVHMTGYYRRFAPDFASRASTMTKLLRKGVVWRWGQLQQAAFEDLKRALTDRPLLAYPDFRKPFRLITDASKTGLGATLTQDQGQGEQPIAYASRVNSETVSKYSITDLECAAVIWAVKLFRPYLYGRRFELITDHAALKYLMTPGKANLVADALSRAPVRTVAAPVDGRAAREGNARDGARDHRGEQHESGMTGVRSKNGVGNKATASSEKKGSLRTVKKLRERRRYGSRAIEVENGLVCIKEDDGSNRVVLPSALWASALRESHDSVYACHLRTPQTDCGSRKSKAKEVIPPLRSQGVGSPGDRWALDAAGPMPVTADGNRYVIAAVDYATRYAVVSTVATHTAKDVARFIADKLVFVHGPMRELVMDGAPELNSEVVKELVTALQASQLTPVPYRPALLGLVERFHRTWKDMVAIYVAEAQNDWDRWIQCAAYAYNGARHSGTGYSPNELMMGRRLRAPNELLRTSGVTQTGPFAEYHRELVDSMAKATRTAHAALAKDQLRREKYYNRRVRQTTEFAVGDQVWVLKPPRGRGITKLAHQWVGPAEVVQAAGFDNWEVTRTDTGERLIVHCSDVVSSRCPSDSLGIVADKILAELAEEGGRDSDDQHEAADEEREERGKQPAELRTETRTATDGESGGNDDPETTAVQPAQTQSENELRSNRGVTRLTLPEKLERREDRLVVTSKEPQLERKFGRDEARGH